jgi:DNA-binding transcriptional LysR family regulator
MVTYDYYRIFYYVVLFGSFSKAAEALGGNQPNIARSINRLESELGCKLFVRSNRGVSLTSEGKTLYKYVSIACEQLDRGETALSEMKGLNAGAVSVGASETALRLFLLDRISLFHIRYPHVRIKIRNSQTPDTLDALEKGLIELAVVTAPFKVSKTFHAERIYSFEEILIASPRQKNFASRGRSVEELTKIPLLSLPKNSSSYEFYTHYFLSHGTSYSPDIETETADQVPPLIMHDLGFSFFPLRIAQQYIEQGTIIQIPLLTPPGMRETWLIYDPKRTRGLAIKKLLECITDPSVPNIEETLR